MEPRPHLELVAEHIQPQIRQPYVLIERPITACSKCSLSIHETRTSLYRCAALPSPPIYCAYVAIELAYDSLLRVSMQLS